MRFTAVSSAERISRYLGAREGDAYAYNCVVCERILHECESAFGTSLGQTLESTHVLKQDFRGGKDHGAGTWDATSWYGAHHMAGGSIKRHHQNVAP